MSTCAVRFRCSLHGDRQTTADACGVVPSNPAFEEYELQAPCDGHVWKQRVDEDEAVSLYRGGAQMVEA